MERFVTMPVGRQFDVAPGLRATFCESGHILGSASIVLDCTEGNIARRLVYSADVGRWGQPIIRDPDPPRGGADVVLLESTYGDRDHPPVQEMMPRLGAIVRGTAARGGRVLIPAFAVGRTQEILYDLHRLARDQAIPPIPIVLDSPLAIAATTVYGANFDAFDRSEELVNAVDDLFAFRQFELARDTQESKALNSRQGPIIIIAGSGMAEGGRILHHLAHSAADPRNTIVIVGYQAEHTLGRCIVERRPTIKVFNETIAVRAHVEVLNGYSAHADRTELRHWLSTVIAGTRRKPRVHLVHGEPHPQSALAELLRSDGFDVNVHALREQVQF
jgi:metallo-beta-lactamase family protein